mmetsp:Transcript_118765/g.206302  ORF Transcript_118765/g.206302 Transcript_118765/m.206302 type:complete len:378 (-) Transcript_118765:165-1298(-)
MDAYTASMSAYPASPVDGTEVSMPYAEGLSMPYAEVSMPYSMGAHPGWPDEEQPIMTAMENAAEDAKVMAFRHSSSASRRNSVSATPVNQDRLKFWQGPPYYPKAAEESARIKDTIMRQPALQVLFGHLSSTAVDSVVGAFFHRPVEVGEILIEQGADGDFFYIVDTGLYEIFVQRRADMLPERVMVAEPGMSFGELALMYSVPRAATVRCAMAGGLWCLDRESFQMMLVTAENSKKGEYDSFLAEVDLLRELTSYERSVLSDMLESELFDDGEEIVRQGEEGNTFYFLYEGQCKAYMLGPHGEVEVMHYMRPGQYFGEVALLQKDCPRQCTVRACYGGCVVLKLRREDVDLSVGSIQDRLCANAASYPQYEAFITR